MLQTSKVLTHVLFFSLYPPPSPFSGIRATVRVGQIKSKSNPAGQRQPTTTPQRVAWGLHLLHKTSRNCSCPLLASYSYMFGKIVHCVGESLEPHDSYVLIHRPVSSILCPFPFSSGFMRVFEAVKYKKETSGNQKNTDSGMQASWLGKTYANLLNKMSKNLVLVSFSPQFCLHVW